MPPVRRSRWKLWAVGLGVISLPAAALGLYTLAALGWSYSDGERAGVLQKFSRKGWICKTYEGELALYVVPGVAPTIWEFTVRDPAVAQQLNAALGKQVSLHYEEHRGVPTSCLGQTAYFVDGIRVVR
jgi:hypothetical protein